MTTREQEQLQRFAQEVLSRGPRACLPKALGAYWLRKLGTQGDALIAGNGEGRTVELVAAVLVLLSHRQGGGEIAVSEEELHEYVVRYAMEISFESITRRTDMTIEAATLDTILTERDIRVDMASLAAAADDSGPVRPRRRARRSRRGRKA